MTGDWENARVDRVATVSARIGWKALTASEYQDDGYAFLSTPNIKNRDIDFNDVNYISKFRFDESPELKLEVGDVLLAKDGSTLGIANVVRDLPRPATVNGSIAVIRPSAVEPRFLMYVLQGAEVQGWIQEVKDGMGVPHLFQADIRKLAFRQPSFEDQRRIADFLDDQVARINKIIAARRHQSDFRDELLRESLSARWQRLAEQFGSTRLGYRLRSLEQGWSPEAEARSADEGEWAVMRAGCVNGGRFDETDHKALPSGLTPRVGYEIKPGDLLMSRASGSRDLIGSVALVPAHARARLLLPDKIYRLGLARGMSPKFAFEMLRSPAARSWIESGISGAEGMANNIPSGVVRSMPIPAVPAPQQARVADEFTSLWRRNDQVHDLALHSAEKLQELKRSLITAAVSGSFDVWSADGSQVPVGVPGGVPAGTAAAAGVSS